MLCTLKVVMSVSFLSVFLSVPFLKCQIPRKKKLQSRLHTFLGELLHLCRGADKSLARPISRCILFDGESISFDASLVRYINSINIPPIMIINRIYETQNLQSL